MQAIQGVIQPPSEVHRQEPIYVERLHPAASMASAASADEALLARALQMTQPGQKVSLTRRVIEETRISVDNSGMNGGEPGISRFLRKFCGALLLCLALILTGFFIYALAAQNLFGLVGAGFGVLLAGGFGVWFLNDENHQ
jgi:hypothetical protein